MSMNKQDAILDAALELFAERGFHGTAVPLVAEKAGVGAGTLYRYFDSKEAIVNAVYQKWKAELGRTLMTDFPLGKPPREQFRDLWRRLCAFANAHPQVLRFLELHHHGSYLDEHSRRVERALLESLRAFVVEAQRLRLLKDIQPELVIAIVYGGFVGLLKGSWDGYFALSPEVIDEGERCMWESVRA
jgi:TetR/AcrR family transcriptional regulator, repressor of fatR-cypB operon